MKAASKTKTMRYSLAHLDWLEKVAVKNGLSEREVIARILDLTLPQLLKEGINLHWSHIEVKPYE